MASFNNSARRVRNPRNTPGHRFLAFLWALDSYAFLTRQSFHAIYRRVGERLGFDWQNRPTGEQLSDAIDLIEKERNQYLVGLRAFARRRIREKAKGQRQPTRKDLERWGWRRPRPEPPPSYV